MAKKNRLNRQRSAFERLKAAGQAPVGSATFEQYRAYLAKKAENRIRNLNNIPSLSEVERDLAFYETMISQPKQAA